MNQNLNTQDRKPTNWYVITGGPCSGKTTTVNMLTAKGYKTTIEHARHYLDTQHRNGKTIEEVKKEPGRISGRRIGYAIATGSISFSGRSSFPGQSYSRRISLLPFFKPSSQREATGSNEQGLL